MWEDLGTHSGAQVTSHQTLFDGLEEEVAHGMKEHKDLLADSVSTIPVESGSALSCTVLGLQFLCIFIPLTQCTQLPHDHHVSLLFH